MTQPWLGKVPVTSEELKALLHPCPGDKIKAWRVAPGVNNVKNKASNLADAIAETLV